MSSEPSKKSNKQINKLGDKEVQHISVFLVFFTTIFLADLISTFIFQNLIFLVEPIRFVFDNYSIAIVMTILILSFTRLIAWQLPELNLDHLPPWYVYIIPLIIFTHPIFIYISGANFRVDWLLIDIIEAGNIFELVIETLILLFAVFAMVRILFVSSRKQEGTLYRYYQYLGNDFALFFYVIFVVYYLFETFIVDGLDALNISYSLKVILIYLYMLITWPLTSE